MIKFFFLTLAFLLCAPNLGLAKGKQINKPSRKPAQGQRPCPKPSAEEEVVYMNEVLFKNAYADFPAIFQKIYDHPKKRLKGRAYFNAEENSYYFDSEHGQIRIDPEFLRSVTRNVETALERGYVDFVMFPDMGHAHFYFPEEEWQKFHKEEYDRKTLTEIMLRQRSLKILYHTAEQMIVRPGERSEGPYPQDPLLLWRYATRNIVGDNAGGSLVYPLFNFDNPLASSSVKGIEGHKEFSAGFYISSSKNGCFPYRAKGKTLYFDLAIDEMPWLRNPNDVDY